jgi:FkbM family methyltransferase
MLTTDEVCRGFRLVLKRDPESQEVIDHWRTVSDFDKLISLLMDSEEFLSRYVCSFPTEKWGMVGISGTKDYIYVDLSDHYVSRGCLFSNYEHNESRFVRGIVQPNDTVLDIGANIGWFTIMMARIVGDRGHVHAFEPRPTTLKHLNMSIARNDMFNNVTTYPQALSDFAGPAFITWRPASRNPGNSWIERRALSDEALKQDPVSMARLDDLSIEKVSFIKIDVEGAEPSVFRGGKKLIARDKPVVLSEINFGQLRSMSGMSWSDYRSFLNGIGYDSFYLVDGKGAASVADAESRGIDVISIAMWSSDRKMHLKASNIWD